MQRVRSFQFVLLLFSLAVVLPSAVAQVAIATVPAGTGPDAVAVNSVTNQTYVANTSCPKFPSCPGPDTVTVIDGTTNNTATVNVGVNPLAVAVDDTQLLIDVNGYFAPAGQGGLSLYPAVPCRVLDTRKIGNGQPFSGQLSPPVDVVNSVCGPSSTAQAYIFNATVVPMGSLGYLTLWPDGLSQPVVSTLNATDGAITSNMAIVPAGDQGKIDAYANGLTQLLLDISSYFAP